MYGARKRVRIHADERDIGEPPRRYCTIAIRAGGHVLSAEEPLPPELRDALAVIT